MLSRVQSPIDKMLFYALNIQNGVLNIKNLATYRISIACDIDRRRRDGILTRCISAITFLSSASKPYGCGNQSFQNPT
jgi:hypothetical protein